MKLKEARTVKGLTQLDLQKKTGIHYSRISLIEKGHAKPSPKEKAGFERALKTPIDWGENTRKEVKVMEEWNKVSRIVDMDGNVLHANYYCGDRLIKSENWEKGFLKVNYYDETGRIINTETYQKKRKKINLNEEKNQMNESKDDYSGVPPMPELRWNKDGTPAYSQFEEDHTDDSIEMVKRHLVLQYGKDEGLQRLKEMGGLQVLELADEIRQSFGAPPMPQMRWGKDGKPCYKHLDEED